MFIEKEAKWLLEDLLEDNGVSTEEESSDKHRRSSLDSQKIVYVSVFVRRQFTSKRGILW